MKLRSFLFFFSLLFSLLSQAQLKSPEAFLGYKIGDRFTPYYQVERYFRYLSETLPAQTSLQQYGTTNEGRPLFIFTVSSAENMQSIESIRINNLKLSGSVRGNPAPTDVAQPVLVWLSYNVHGNEASSTEASMLTAFELLRAGTPAAAWLKNTVVLIDPCLNPDGRERYVNWYQSVVGSRFNPLPRAREHQEPWPGGRSNHYYFDLNRDWAWLTQTESKQRIQLYRKWMPQVHVDFHEQGYNEPYYFAPAAEPFHEVITPWQREFQQLIGKNHARYFDQKGWLYFTRERFDLLYPSYGDTYPIYNGAIGMTYEQGGIRAGLGVINEDGDTLKLSDRAVHHFTTSISTIEFSSLEHDRLLKEYQHYFEKAQKEGVGKFKSFVVKYESDKKERIEKLLELLEKHGVQYGNATATSAKGYSYATAKEESFVLGKEDIVIPAEQPGSALLQVLMEPQTLLSDSITYDITAWALPYAYGLSAYASKESIAFAKNKVEVKGLSNPPASYGYALRWKGMKAARFSGHLLQEGVLLRYAEEGFSVNGQQFDPGTILIIRTSNENFGKDFLDQVRQKANQEGVELVPLVTGMADKGPDFGSDRVHPLHARRVALLTGEGTSSLAVGEVWHFMEKELDYPVTLLSTSNFSAADLSNFDVLILADGNYRFLDNKESFEGLKNWLNGGGKLVALEGAVAQLARLDLGIKIKKKEDDASAKKEEPLKEFGQRERNSISAMTSGSVWKLNIDRSHPLAFGFGDRYYSLKADEMLYEYFDNSGWNVGVIKQEGPVAGFVGSQLRSKLKDGWLIGQLKLGKGVLNLFADNFLFRNFWEEGKLFLPNAIFFDGE